MTFRKYRTPSIPKFDVTYKGQGQNSVEVDCAIESAKSNKSGKLIVDEVGGDAKGSCDALER